MKAAELTADERDMRTAMARAIWKTRHADDAPQSQEDRIAAWQAAKPEMMREATKVIRKLEEDGFSLHRATAAA